jgi:hypothetical protein
MNTDTNRAHHTLCAAVATAGLAAAATADTVSAINLKPSSFPSEQPGWEYEAANFDAGVPEVDVFRPGVDSFTINTMGIGFGNRPGSNQAVYDIAPFAVSTVSSMMIQTRFRVLESEVAQFHYGFGFGMAINGQVMSLGFSTDRMSFTGSSTVPFDATEWNEFRLVGDLNSDTFDVWINDELFTTRPLTGLSRTYVFIGDATGSANARTEVDYFRAFFIPTPGTVAVLGAAAALTTRRAR